MHKRVTLADVANAAGVSRTTASLVLSDRGDELRISEASQQRVRRVAAELGYRPNVISTNLRSGSSQTIGFISDTVATSQLAGDMIKGALEHAHRNGYMLFIGETEGDLDEERRLVQAMVDRQVDGLIVASMFTLERSVPAGIDPGAVVLLNALPEAPADAVIPDEYAAGRAAVETLLARGHTRVHLLGAGPGRTDVPGQTVAGSERLGGILDALSDAGLEPASGRLARVWLPEDGFAAMRDLLDTGVRGEAVIAFNDRLAFGAYQAVQEAGLRIPDDFSIISFDDHQLAGWLHPALTTFALPHYDLGRRAVEILLARADTRREPAVERLPMPLRVRGSVAAPRA
ncbi:LacI family DNA-binding transcriptional regulator [Microbacterium chocolatum]|uniref:LacI family DNA-binding transcriptional regulator n=1 Tax=Microbacterium aurantiacum TaxID=162393 RepID=UPI00338F5FC3